MKCKVCNAELSEGQAFCAYCGTKIEAETITEEAVNEPAQQPPAQTVPVYNPPRREENETSPADGKALAGLILGICSMVFCYIGLPSGIIGIIMSAKGLKSKTRIGMAIPGLILSILAVIISLTYWLILLASVMITEMNISYQYMNTFLGLFL